MAPKNESQKIGVGKKVNPLMTFALLLQMHVLTLIWKESIRHLNYLICFAKPRIMHRDLTSPTSQQWKSWNYYCQISRHSVRYWHKAYDRGDIDNDQDTTSWPTFRKVSVRDAELIVDCFKKDPSTSSRQVYELKAAGAQSVNNQTRHRGSRIYCFQAGLQSTGERG